MPSEVKKISIKLRQPASNWLYELRLRMGQDGQLATVAHVVRSALRALNAQHAAAMAMERAELPQDGPK